MRVEAWSAIATAFSSVPPFLRYADPGSPEAVIAELGSYPRCNIIGFMIGLVL
jgi:hypothetical protein